MTVEELGLDVWPLFADNAPDADFHDFKMDLRTPLLLSAGAGGCCCCVTTDGGRETVLGGGTGGERARAAVGGEGCVVCDG